MASEKFQNDITRHLETRGISQSVAKQVAELLDAFLEFRVEGGSEDDFDAYVCFAFGNKPDEFANLQPGELNETLARIVKDKYKNKRKPIITQWEIGELLNKEPDIDQKDIESYGQDFDKVFGKPIYQSTKSFLDKVARKDRSTPIKRLFVVAQWFHYARCVQEVKNAGFEVVVDQDAMPKDFCTKCFGQLWTSSEERFVLHTLIGSLNRY
ncbi:MAG: hypothetical protein ACRD5H_15905, partial [Nitrososphaerales archaeon]